MQATQHCVVLVALAASSAFASASSNAAVVWGTAPKAHAAGVSTASHPSTLQMPATGRVIRINPQPLPPVETRLVAQPSRAGGDPPTVIDNVKGHGSPD